MRDDEFRSKYGPWALVTGASDGIGRELAVMLAAKGMNVVVVARRAERLQHLCDALTSEHGAETRPVAADLGSASDVDMVLEQLDDLEIGLYVANAGFGTAGAFADNEIAVELDMIDVNCRALTALTHPLARKMSERKRGGMIFLSSVVAFQGAGYAANYAATKAFVQSFAEGLAIELRSHGIDVLASAPGPVATGFAARANMQMDGAASPKSVARATLAALGSTTTVRPGFKSKLLGYGLSTLPRVLRRRILTGVMAGSTNHRNDAKEA